MSTWPSPAGNGGLSTPSSAITPATKEAGVTSKAGFQALGLGPGAASGLSRQCVTSLAGRSSMGMASPVAAPRSRLLCGAHAIKQNPMGPGDKGQVRPGLVGHVAVARNPVTVHRHQIDVTLTHKQASGPVSDHGTRHPVRRCSFQADRAASWSRGRVFSSSQTSPPDGHWCGRWQ